MDFLQRLIHRLEVGSGSRYVRIALSVLVLLAVAVGYDWRAFRNISTQEGMDAAQVARNLAQGKGYTTLFIRPLSIYLLSRQQRETQVVPQPGPQLDQAQLKGMHPDIANPPLYPVLLAGLIKALPFQFVIPETPRPFWSRDSRFWRHQPDFVIAVFNQVLFFVVLLLVFLLAQRLFDRKLAWFSALLLLGTDQLWRFSVSGLSTMLLLLIFVALLWCMVLLEEETREPKWGAAGLYLLAGLAGAVVGLGALTRYSFGWLIVPVVLFAILMSGRQNLVLGLTALLAFAALLGPWVGRNYSLSGTAFGTSSYALLEGSSAFPEHNLQRSLTPDFNQANVLSIFKSKLLANSARIVQTELPKLGGTWLAAFFMVGLLVRFEHPTARWLRYFLVTCLVILALVQALGRTQLSDDSPEINSENLLVLGLPLVVIYGVGLVYQLFDQIVWPVRELRYVGLGVLGAIACLPLILTFMAPPTPFTIVQSGAAAPYTLYYPPTIQRAAGYAKPDELTMSDIPWAMAWYGQAQCVWLTLDPQTDFLAINDDCKPVQALYLAQTRIEGVFTTVLSKAAPWDKFLMSVTMQLWDNLSKDPERAWPRPVQVRTARGTFPLQNVQVVGLPQMLLLTSRPEPPRPP
jgi:hypothetical protein